jgi:hypothetical protein
MFIKHLYCFNISYWLYLFALVYIIIQKKIIMEKIEEEVDEII